MRAIVSLAVALLGCSSDSAPTKDAAVASDAPADAVVDGASTVDADMRACANVGDCPCFTNYDCPATHACVSQDQGGNSVSCVAGPRGTGAAGTPCTGEADCASALCVEDSMNGMRCSDVCTMPEQCPPELPRCLGALGICARAL
ncbi:MAG: hypothetical protein H0T79_19055 [Deltaproteobacteria bacterium]|nr:hypothetical protein [Deltaproteobacteria bacterium]